MPATTSDERGLCLDVEQGRRIGKYALSIRYVHEAMDGVRDAWRIAFAWSRNVIVLEAATRYDLACVEVTALSPYFRLVEHGACPPYYDINVMCDGSFRATEAKSLNEIVLTDMRTDPPGPASLQLFGHLEVRRVLESYRELGLAPAEQDEILVAVSDRVLDDLSLRAEDTAELAALFTTGRRPSRGSGAQGET